VACLLYESSQSRNLSRPDKLENNQKLPMLPFEVKIQ
jgi:hypothetical protein